jgi:hypothetical protein
MAAFKGDVTMEAERESFSNAPAHEENHSKPAVKAAIARDVSAIFPAMLRCRLAAIEAEVPDLPQIAVRKRGQCVSLPCKNRLLSTPNAKKPRQTARISLSQLAI